MALANIDELTDEQLKELATNCLERLPLAERIQTVISAFHEVAEFEELEIQVEMSKEQAQEEEGEEEEAGEGE